ncbi:hypothetical protein K7432_011958 [Basidiobolus ranarum]|uniref:Nudix hydrolase domain-containing protein n=1 Tax=Basidiobolus ranarum TaxID=34480 RepID=A0ABR2VTV3_9FUNG
MTKISLNLPIITQNPQPTEKLGNGQWLGLERIYYTLPNTGEIRQWEVCRRASVNTTKMESKKEEINAVDVVAIIHQEKQKSIVLVVQYRPAVDTFTIEFPSGLIDKDEDVKAAALRELKEETGYVGELLNISPTICYEPGLTDSCCKLAFVKVVKV